MMSTLFSTFLLLWILSKTTTGFNIGNTMYASAKFINRKTSLQQVRNGSIGDLDVETEKSNVMSGERNSIDVSALNELNYCTSGTTAKMILKNALIQSRNEEDITYTAKPLFGSICIPQGASDRGLSDSDLAIQTKIRNKKYSVMDLIELNGNRDIDRASLGIFGITIGSFLSALVANENLPGPEILRFLVVWIFSFLPLAFVGYGIATPDKLQALLVGIQRNIFPTYRTRMVQHEAGHFLMGHLLGLPIRGYSTNAVKNAVDFYPLNDATFGFERAKQLGFDVSSSRNTESTSSSAPSSLNAPYFSKEGRGSDVIEQRSVFRNAKNYTENEFLKIPSENDPTKAWPYRKFDSDTVDKLAVVSVAGICAEIITYGNAEGGTADLNQLRELCSKAEPELNDRDVENRIRYCIGYTMTQLRLHLGVLDDLADAMDKGASVSECIAVIENCSNISGQDSILGYDYEVRRRQKFKLEQSSIIEKILLFDEKNADTKETRLVQGKGGGYRKERFVLSGDDPLYAAVGTSLLFLLWALSGGITLH